ncbi:DUF952 domain-containing protein [Acidocella sp.]|uniref:DUF952 domain-containing protein n=1 Tax=Acidocella sp. TaxID=50710 RepID=UPI002F401013
MQDAIAYKILLPSEWAALARDGGFAGAPVDIADGFIHMSTATQLDETLRKHFVGLDGLWIAAVDLAALGDLVRWEPSRGGALFPHLYGMLPLSAVVAHGPLARHEDGSARLPSVP